MPVFKTMTEAVQYVSRRRDRRQIWCIVSLEGAQYYGLFSQPNLGGYAYNQATKMFAVNGKALTSHLLHNQGTKILAVNDKTLTSHSPHVQVRGSVARLKDFLYSEAQSRGVVQHDRHAEEIFLEQWGDCLTNYRILRGRDPKKVDIFLSHTPCTLEDKSPSPSRLLGNSVYPLSCTNKLELFAKKNPAIKLRIYYYNKFGVNESLDENGVEQYYRKNSLVVTRMGLGVRNTCQTIL